MSEIQDIDSCPEKDQADISGSNIAPGPSEVTSVTSSIKNVKHSSSERQIKFERAQKCLENAALVSKRIREHQRAAAELLGRPYEDDNVDTTSEMASTMSERTGYSVATDTSTTLSVQDALNIPGISESLANTLKQKELLMERIKQYKEISKRPMKTSATVVKRERIIDTKEAKKSTDTDVAKLVNALKEKENNLSIMQVKVRAMETTILDLQEKINEKDQIIEAKNKATTLITDSLSKKEKDSLELLEDTKQQMTKMQQNFIAMETEWKEEKQRLLLQIAEKNDRIVSLEEANNILENSRFEISVAHSKLLEELNLKNGEITELVIKIQQLSDLENSPVSMENKQEFKEEKGTVEINNMVELTKKIELLEQLNYQIRQTNKDLENQLASVSTEIKPAPTSTPSKKASPLQSRKSGRAASKVKSPWSNISSESAQQDVEKKILKNDTAKLEMLLQSLNKDIVEKECAIIEKDALILELQSLNSQKEAIINELKLSAKPSVVLTDVGICTENVSQSIITEPSMEDNKSVLELKPESLDLVKELEQKLKVAEDQIKSLTDEIDAANKNMIKVKSNTKIKLKQMQKTIDNFSKVSDANAEIVKLNEDLHLLSQKVAELEEEKGNLQLHLVDYDSGRLTETEVYKKLLEIENLAEARLKSISLLETQKFDLVQELHTLQQKNSEMEDKLADMSQLQNEHVCSEMNSVQLEEQLDEIVASKKELELVIENLKLDREQLGGSIKMLQEEKENLVHKLENYIQENMELTDKLEKLSTEKVSSAESIEIVESLTTQERLELEEYNKGIVDEKINEGAKEDHYSEPQSQNVENVEKLLEQITDLNKKVELFTHERQEVMEKMAKICSENETLHEKINEFNFRCDSLRRNIEVLIEEKEKMQSLNDELNRQIEELKRERIEIIKETVEVVKPSSVEDVMEAISADAQDEKSTGDKGINRSKSVKQLTKEILKLKNTIKEREAEIADCQMKILSLEEQQEKQKELIQTNISNESLLKRLTDENCQLKKDVESINQSKETESQLLQLKQSHELLQQELQKMHQDYSTAINNRDSRIHEMDRLLKEYEVQVFNYGNTLQQKDKEMADYINQITKLNDVSQKLKSTIEVLEEEKVKDQNLEITKSLNKQISMYQKTLADYEEKMRNLEDEKVQLLTLKSVLENKSGALEAEIKKLQESCSEKQNVIKELQTQQQSHSEDLSSAILQVKERDEDIHEIKLQLRKESIENEKLRTSLLQKETEFNDLQKSYESTKANLDAISSNSKNTTDQYIAMENKNKELMEKLKKFAISIKKKSAMYVELETQLNETQKQLEAKNEQLDQLLIQVETIPVLHDKLKHAEEEYNRIQSERANLEQNIIILQTELKSLNDSQSETSSQILKLNESLAALRTELHTIQEENNNLKSQNEVLINKLAENEIDQKNNANLVTKLSCLESELNQKQIVITELTNKLETQEQHLILLQFGHDAKVQERDLYIESLQIELDKYKNRIVRLEESVSLMEDRRHSLERKADQLDVQLQEKQKAYTDYTVQEDELVNRLAILIDHDRVIDKQINAIDSENKELQNKVQNLNDEYSRLHKSHTELQEHCRTLEGKAEKSEILESEFIICQTKLRDVEGNLKRITNDHQVLISEKKRDLEELESEFNTQIENSIKEKKLLSENYEKVCERVSDLEHKLNEYRMNIDRLNINLEELMMENEKLQSKSGNDVPSFPDYTEQYINEINKLNAIMNNKNEEIVEMGQKIQMLQSNNVSLQGNIQSKVTDLTEKLEQSSLLIEKLTKELNQMKVENEQQQVLLGQKNDQIRQLMEKKKLIFEMNIPKTEGMTISSTIEELSNEQRGIDLSSIEAEIISAQDIEPHVVKKRAIDNQGKEISGGVLEVESIIEPKTTYLCYSKGDNAPEEYDPFNSEEGWGLEGNEEISEVTPGLSHLNEEIRLLKENNIKLKSDLEASNCKLLKALKKLKELKSTRDMLSNELKISKQISQSSVLDMAIENELSSNVEELEKKIQDLNNDLQKEKREKDALKKQNEVIKNANDKLLEIKEKMDNEIELWKYNFKQANDKISTLQWNSESKESFDLKTSQSVTNIKDPLLQDEITKLEKENDEFQSIIDNLNEENKKMSNKLVVLQNEISELNAQLKTNKTSCENCQILNQRILDLQNVNIELNTKVTGLSDELQDLQKQYDDQTLFIVQLKSKNDETKIQLEENKREDANKILKLEEDLQKLKLLNLEAKNYIVSLNTEIDTLKSKLLVYEEQQHSQGQSIEDFVFIKEKLNEAENNCMKLQKDLEDSNRKIDVLNIENKDLVYKSEKYDLETKDLKEKVLKLNAENDQLLSTVTELRSSVSSAMDQRGFEIAELWKQHLAQRECEFQNFEQDLRLQLSAAEAKYEQLLDSVQSSSQEETNKLIIMEQVTSLQNKVQEKEEHLNSLQDKYANLMSQMDLLRSDMEDEKLLHENKILVQQEEYEKITKELTNEHEIALKNLQIEIAAAKQTMNELRNVYEGKILDLSNQLQLKEGEIYQKAQEYSVSLTQKNEEFEYVRKQLIDYEKKIEDLTFEKESELAVLRLKMHENGEHSQKIHKELEDEQNNLSEALKEKIVECTNLNKQINNLNKILEEYVNRSTEMQTALENQELEIVTLKDDLSSMKEMMRSSTSRMEKHVTFSSDTKLGTDGDKSASILNKDLLDAVPRAELDLALYMLHQRDVRCEELTMELTQLLEERDTLQLRLSDSLRSYEELKLKCGTAMDVSSGSQETSTELPSFALEREQQFVDTHRGQTSRSSSLSDPDGEKPKLQAKLSELRSVKHSRDVRLRQDSEQRQLGMRLLHRDVANLPPEAVDQLTQAHHTLSRDSQSTPTVLLNWLRGKSTPKVVHM